MSDSSSVEEHAALQHRVDDLELLTCRCAHELQGSLVTIAGYLKGLPEQARAGRWPGFDADFQRVTCLVEQQRRRLDSVLRLLRSESRSEPAQALSLKALVQDVVAEFESECPADHVRVTVGDGALSVRGRPAELRDVLHNLLENAAKFAVNQEGCVNVEITFHRAENDLIVRFRDDGPGIPTADRDRVFEPFVRLGTAPSGSGLGLYLVKRIIAAHHGRVWIEAPASGPGTVVCFTLPVAE
ncbi:MAG TPA: HAMP domain-containing sensor histidine kinase [Planctomycetaceae bacterium]|nr:HAMP domain-containing sensor histidine kinase [Planctomycetaceae bacterium]